MTTSILLCMGLVFEIFGETLRWSQVTSTASW